jgi:tRNA (adenine57-N1/adenine58-N1)-methyltransferase
MDFALTHVHEESLATRSKIRYIELEKKEAGEDEPESLDDMVIQSANQTAVTLLLGNVTSYTTKQIDSTLFPERITPQTETIQRNQLVVIFESFDNLNFTYATPGDIFSNRNGNFHHEDFIGKPFGCKIRSRNNRGYGFVYLIKPTPELWTRSLNHRTQIVHELDASMVVFYLNLRPNMVVCESGTGSGAMSHFILRTIAPSGKLHSYEFNKVRAETAEREFEKNGVGHLVKVYHKDVCGKSPTTEMGGFELPAATVDAIFLDLPEPWLAIAHAAHVLKPNARIATYSPCVEQSQRTLQVMRQCGFHSCKTVEFRLREHYVDEVEYEMPPKEKRPRTSANPYVATQRTGSSNSNVDSSGGEDTGAEAENEKSKCETEGDQESAGATAVAGTLDEPSPSQHLKSSNTAASAAAATTVALPTPPPTASSAAASATTGAPCAGGGNEKTTASAKRPKVLVARPFSQMRGHTAFLTFATAGNKPQPDPNKNLESA